MSDDLHERVDEIIKQKDETVAQSREVRGNATATLDALRKAVDTLASTQIDIAQMMSYPRWQNWSGRE